MKEPEKKVVQLRLLRSFDEFSLVKSRILL
jgi:hypothetical protein